MTRIIESALGEEEAPIQGHCAHCGGPITLKAEQIAETYTAEEFKQTDAYSQEDEAFERCVDNGGKVRTVTGPNEEHGLEEGEYVYYCIDEDGKTHRGEKHVKKGYESSSESLSHEDNDKDEPDPGYQECVDNGGQVRTISGPDDNFNLAADEYVYVCLDGSGRAYRDAVKTKKDDDDDDD